MRRASGPLKYSPTSSMNVKAREFMTMSTALSCAQMMAKDTVATLSRIPNWISGMQMAHPLQTRAPLMGRNHRLKSWYLSSASMLAKWFRYTCEKIHVLQTTRSRSTAGSASARILSWNMTARSTAWYATVLPRRSASNTGVPWLRQPLSLGELRKPRAKSAATAVALAQSTCAISDSTTAGYQREIASITKSWEPLTKAKNIQTIHMSGFAQGALLYVSGVAFLATRYVVE
mmetsp:Transcript_80184/g.227021  ORF Transcript_80184/g.227021 Transcript_80184/m.227021 type:complete len:232 (+) Transcript_80184:406-1101(+)